MTVTRTAVILALAATLCCGAVPATAREKHRVSASGFLGDYSDLEPHPEEKGLLVYKLRDQVLADYDRFVLEHPLIYFSPDAQGLGVDPRDLEMLAADLHQKLTEAITEADGFALTEETGAGVARVRVAITELVPVDPKRNVAAKAAGMAVGVGLLVPRVDLGKAAIEAEIVDSESGERLVALAATREARRLGGVIKGAKEWGDARAAFERWAKQFRKRLNQLHGTGGD